MLRQYTNTGLQIDVPKILNYLLEISAINVFGIKCVKRVGFVRYSNVIGLLLIIYQWVLRTRC